MMYSAQEYALHKQHSALKNEWLFVCVGLLLYISAFTFFVYYCSLDRHCRICEAARGPAKVHSLMSVEVSQSFLMCTEANYTGSALSTLQQSDRPSCLSCSCDRRHAQYVWNRVQLRQLTVKTWMKSYHYWSFKDEVSHLLYSVVFPHFF